MTKPKSEQWRQRQRLLKAVAIWRDNCAAGDPIAPMMLNSALADLERFDGLRAPMPITPPVDLSAPTPTAAEIADEIFARLERAYSPESEGPPIGEKDSKEPKSDALGAVVPRSDAAPLSGVADPVVPAGAAFDEISTGDAAA